MASRLKTDDDLLAELARDVERYPSDSAAAKAFGVSRSHLSRVLSGQKPMTRNLAHGLGYEQQHPATSDTNTEIEVSPSSVRSGERVGEP